MNEEALEALDYLRHIGSIAYRIERDEEDSSRITSCHITIRRFCNFLNRDNFDEERQEQAFYAGMGLQNFVVNLFYSVQFSFWYEHMPVEDMEEDDPLPEWFMDWWKIYGLSPLILKPYSFTLLKIPNFTPQTSCLIDVLRKTINDLINLSDVDFLQGVRRCGHVRWFVMNRYKERVIRTSNNSSYEDFHQQINPEDNPFLHLNYLELPNPHDINLWETEKEVWVQYYSNYLIEQWNLQNYSWPQVDYYTMM